MGRTIRLLIVLVFAGAALLAAADVQPGDQVRFITREQHIPAHPAPGDTRVHLRFVSGSEATVLRVHSATGWIEVRGEPVQGTENTGWVTLSYLAQQPGGGPHRDTLAWCPAKGSPAPHPSGRLRLATWNLENLHAQDGQSTYTDEALGDAHGHRLRPYPLYVRLFDPDILAVQEVDGEAALSRVVDTEVYDVHVDDRPKGSLNGQQNTGFAFKRGLTVVRRPDFQALDVQGDGCLRYGARIDVTHNGQTIQLMSVHLKSQCVENASTEPDCAHAAGAGAHAGGLDRRGGQGADAVHCAGDFNRRLNQPGDQVWADLDDGDPANADLTALTQEMPVSCRDNHFPEFIDHIVVEPRVLPWVDRSSFRQITYRQADKAVWNKLSDHCPVAVELWVR